MYARVEDVLERLAENTFGRRTYLRGLDYQRRGRVLSVAVDAATGMLRGKVQGTARRPYAVEVTPGSLSCVAIEGGSDDEAPLSTECTCPVGIDCKHGVALVLEAAARGLLAATQDARAPRDGGDGARAASRPRSARPGDVEPSSLPPPAAPAPVTSAPARATPALPAGLTHWLEDLVQATTSASDAYPPEIAERLVYVLVANRRASGNHVALLRPMRTRRLKDGSFSPQAQSYDPGNVVGGKGARFLRPSDHAILRRLAFCVSADGSGRVLAGEEGAEILAAALKTGRVRLGSVAGAQVLEDRACAARVVWRVEPDAGQVVTLEPVASESGEPEPGRDGGLVLTLAPPFRLRTDLEGGPALCGPLETGLAPLVAQTLLSAPPVPPEAAAALARRLAALFGESALPAPREFALAREIAGPPRAALVLSGEALARRAPDYGWGRPRMRHEELGIVRLSFRYGDLEIAHDERADAPTRLVDGAPVLIRRDATAERAARERLACAGLVPLAGRYELEVPPSLRGAFTTPASDGRTALEDFLLFDVPELQDEGFLVTVEPSFPVEAVRLTGEIETRLESGSGIDWLELTMGVVLDGERVDVLVPLLDVIERIPAHALEDVLSEEADDEEEVRLRLADGRLLLTRFGRVRPILLALARFAGRERSGRLALRALDAADLAETERIAGEALAWSGAEGLRALGRCLRDAAAGPRPVPPPEFAARLRPYQSDGLAWLQALREAGFGGVLADDMGLGKTVQTLAYLAVEKARGGADRPSLIVAPTSVIHNWAAEAARFAPGLSVLVLQGPERKARFSEIARHDLVLSTYPLLRHDGEVLCAQDWHLLILDEAQAIKNDKTEAARTLKRLEARQRIALTGTPVENSLTDLWSIYDVVCPGLLGDRTRFVREFRTPIEKHADAAASARLARGLRPFLMRRTKDEVVTELPQKTEMVEAVRLGERQRAVYEGVRLMMHRKVREAIARKGLARSRIELLEALLRLRQICCDPRLVADTSARDAKAPSAKLARLMELVTELVAENRRILVFSQFTSMLDLIVEALDAAGIGHVCLTGKTRDRVAPVERFRAGAVPVFLISLKAGGTGLNLTAADTVIHYDPWWNPAVEVQATDRSHRIGQDKPVFVHKLICEDTVETKIEALKARKKALADGIFDPTGKTPLDLDEADIDFLLS